MKIFTALEQNTETCSETPSETTVEQDILEVSSLNSEIEQHSEVVDEATCISDTISVFSDQISKNLDSGTQISEQTAAVIDAAMEHFRKRLQYSGDIFPSLEQFTVDAPSNEKASRLALENIQSFQDKIEKGLSVSQEGLADKVLTAFSMTFTSESKVLTKLDTAMSTMASNGAKEDTIKAGAWAAYLTTRSGQLDGQQVISLLTTIDKTFSDEAIIKKLREIEDCYKRLTKEVRGNWFVSNKNDIKRINDISKEVKQIIADIGFKREGQGTDEQKAKPITLDEAKKISNLCSKILEDKKVQTFMKDMREHSVWSGLFMLINSNLRLKSVIARILIPAPTMAVKILSPLVVNSISANYAWLKPLGAEDIVEAQKAIDEIWGFLRVIQSGVYNKVRVVNAVSDYIKSSTK